MNIKIFVPGYLDMRHYGQVALLKKNFECIVKSLIIIAALLCFSVISANAQLIHLKKHADGFWIMEDQDKIFFFQKTMNDSVPGYARNNYFHPVYDLNGQILTEDFPADHPHQRGLFWAWHQVLIDGQPVCDPWDTKDFFQNITDVEFYVNELGRGILRYTSFWHTTKKTDDPFLMEKTEVIIHPRTAAYRQIDFKLNFRALEHNLFIGGSDDEKGYGGFTMRMQTNKHTLFSAEIEKNLTPQNLSVPVGQFVHISNPELKRGVTLISSPDNPGETRWILRQTGSAQNCAWPGRNAIPFKVDEPVQLKYSVIIHKGKPQKLPMKRILKNNKS
jgi:hypothetical protein